MSTACEALNNFKTSFEFFLAKIETTISLTIDCIRSVLKSIIKSSLSVFHNLSPEQLEASHS